ncbi:MAG TPA: hypothetical protein VGB82_14985 [Alphaproteobacteria bacterium]
MDTTPFFTGPELFVFVLFAGGLVWLVIDIAIRDIHIFGRMLRDSEKFAKPDEPAKDEPAMSAPPTDKAAPSVVEADFVAKRSLRGRPSKRAGAR